MKTIEERKEEIRQRIEVRLTAWDGPREGMTSGNYIKAYLACVTDVVIDQLAEPTPRGDLYTQISDETGVPRPQVKKVLLSAVYNQFARSED